MKSFVLLLSLVISCASYATGRLSIQGTHFTGDKGYKPMVGLSVDEKLIGKLFVNSWLGFGARPDNSPFVGEKKEWSTLKASLDYRISGISIGAGVFSNSDWGAHFLDAYESGYFVKASMKLW